MKLTFLKAKPDDLSSEVLAQVGKIRKMAEISTYDRKDRFFLFLVQKRLISYV